MTLLRSLFGGLQTPDFLFLGEGGGSGESGVPMWEIQGLLPIRKVYISACGKGTNFDDLPKHLG